MATIRQTIYNTKASRDKLLAAAGEALAQGDMDKYQEHLDAAKALNPTLDRLTADLAEFERYDQLATPGATPGTHAAATQTKPFDVQALKGLSPEEINRQWNEALGAE